MVTRRPYQVKEAADQVAVFSHVCDLKSNSWLHADRTYETMATMCHHPAQWADHHRASLFLVRWTFFGLERFANQSSDEGFTSCYHICLSLPFMDLSDTGDQVQFCFRCSLCLGECASTVRWYMDAWIQTVSYFTPIQNLSVSIYVAICKQFPLLHRERMETKVHHHSRHDPTFCSLIWKELLCYSSLPNTSGVHPTLNPLK